MKRTIIITALIISSFLSKSQTDVKLPVDSVSGKIMFAEKIKVDSVSKDELYNRASTWFAQAFKSSKNIIQKDDRTDGVIIGKPLFIHYMKGLFGENIGEGKKVYYSISVYVKPGKYRYEITDFLHESTPIMATNSGYTKGYWNLVRKHCKEESDALIVSLKESMNKASKNSEW